MGILQNILQISQRSQELNPRKLQRLQED